MTTSDLKKIVINSLKNLCEKDLILIEKSLKEECINHRLALYIENNKTDHPELTNIDVDLEYNKYEHDHKKMMNQTPIRPDILVHKRESGNSSNHIAIETKKSYSSQHDKKKIKHLVNSGVFDYTLGCVISFQPEKEYLIIQFLESGSEEWEKHRFYKKPFREKKNKNSL